MTNRFSFLIYFSNYITSLSVKFDTQRIQPFVSTLDHMFLFKVQIKCRPFVVNAVIIVLVTVSANTHTLSGGAQTMT